MKKPIRILIVEDKVDDADLAKYEIRKTLSDCEFQVAETRDGFIEALETFRPDVILSDYTLPHFDGMNALMFSLEYAPLTPFIVWAGSISEDAAVNCMKAGANNYILKDNLKRLGPAIIHALEEKEQMIARKQAEQKYQSIFENSMEGIFQSSPLGHYLSLNPAMARLYGYASPKEMLESIQNIAMQIYVEPEKHSEFMSLLSTQNSVEFFEAGNYRKDGSLIWTSTSARTVRDPHGKILYYEGFIQDITQRRTMEEALQNSEKRFRALIENGLDDISLLAVDGTLLWESPSTIRNLGYAPDEFVGRNIFELMHPEDLEWTRNTYVKLLKEPGTRQRGKFRLRRSAGAWRWVEAIATNMLHEPGVNAIVINYRDITEQKQAEIELQQRNADLALVNALNESINRGEALEAVVNLLRGELKRIFSSEYTNIYLLDQDGKSIRMQQYSLPPEVTGKIERVIGRAIPAINIPVQKDGYFQRVLRSDHGMVISGPEVTQKWMGEFIETAALSPIAKTAIRKLLPQLHKILNIKSTILVPLISDGKALGLLNVSGSNTFTGEDLKRIENICGQLTSALRRRQVEELLNEERNLLRTLIDNIPDRIYAMDLQGRKTLSNIADWKASGGKTMEDVIGKTDFDTYPPEMAEQFWKLDKAVLDSGQPVINYEEPGLDADGNLVSILTTKIPLRDDEGKVIGLAGIGRDISERKRAEKALYDSEQRYRALFEDMPIAIWEEDLSQVKSYLKALKQQGVTDFRTYFTTRPDALLECAGLIKVTKVNNAAVRMFEADSKEQLIESTDNEVSQGEREHLHEFFADIAEGQTSNSWEGADKTLTGRPVDIHLSWSVAPEKQEDDLRVIVTTRDITERRQAEIERQALLEIMQGLANTKDLQELLKLVHHSIAKVIYAENFFVVLHHKSRGWFEEIYSVDQYDPPAPPSNLENSITSYVYRSGKPLLLTRALFDELAAKGEVKLVGTDSASWLGVPLKTSDRTIGVMVVQDYENDNRYSEHDKDLLASIATQVALVIERRRAEESLHRSEALYRQAIEVAGAVPYYQTYYDDGKLINYEFIGEGIRQITGYGPEEFSAVVWDSLVEEINLVDDLAGYSLDEGIYRVRMDKTAIWKCEHRIRDRYGKIHWVFEAAVELRDENGVSYGSIGTYQDITTRKQAEESLRAERKKAQDYLNIAGVIMLALDRDARVTLINQKGCEILEYPADEIIGKDWINTFLPEADREELQEVFQKRISGNIESTDYYENSVVTKSGEPRLIAWHNTLVRDMDGKIIGTLSSGENITERKRAEEEIRRGAKETSALLETSLALTHLDLEATLQTIGNSANSLFLADGCRIFLMEPDDETLRCVLALRENTVAFSDLKIKVGEGVTGAVAASGRAEIVNWMQNDPRAVQVPGTQEEQEAIMFAPLKESDRTIGVLSIRRVGRKQPFQTADLELLEAFASMAASAVSKARLFEETQRRLAELRASEERFRQLADNIQEAFWMTDIENSREIYMSPAAETIWGRSVQSLMYEPNAFITSVFSEDRPAVMNALEKEKHGEKMQLEYRIVRPDGSLRWIWDRAFPIFDDSGKVRRIAGISADITERKQAEQELRKLSRAVEQSGSTIVITDTSGTIEYINPKFTQITGYSYDEAIGQNPSILKSGFTSDEEYKQLWQTISRGNEWHGELLNKKKDGTLYWESVAISPILNDRKEITHFVGVKEDITERKHNEMETRRHIAELEAVYENGLSVGRLLEPGEIGNRVIETFARYLPWHHVTIRLRKEGSDDLELIAFNVPDLKEEEKEGVRQHFDLRINKVGQGLSGWVIQTGEPLRTGNVLVHPQYIDTQAGIQSGLYMPLKIGDRVIGVISVESEAPDAFTEQDERLLATLANQTAVAFENARLYEAMQKELLERKQVEDALRNSETHYRALADSITDILFELDQELRYTHWNKASETLTGIPAEEAIGKPMEEIFGATDEQAAIRKIYEGVLNSHRPRTFETILILGGEKRFFEINAYPSTRGVSVVAKDVTDRKRTETIMQKRFELMEYSARHTLNELMQKTVDEVSELTGSSIGFFHFMDEDQVNLGIQTCSSNSLRLCQVPVDAGTHLPLDQAGVWAEAVRQRRPLIQNEYESLAKKKGIPEGHVPIVREIVIPIIRNERIMAVMGIGNKPQEYTSHDLGIAARMADYAWDITERKQMEIALEVERNQLVERVEERTADLSRANSNLARALRVKDEFLANMSHELRTPLNAILGLSESLGEQIAGPLNEKQQKYISTISESGHHLLSLINDILDLAKIEAGQITLDINKMDIHSVCQASLRMIKQLAQKKNQEVSLEIDKGLGLMWADERRLKQMIVNLLGNAVKFTPDNGKLGLEVRGDEEANQIAITVWDNGIGIKQNDLARLFQPFIQLDSGLAREATGTGLGLALVAQMARLHGGSVNAVSEAGKGSRFTIILPWEPALAIDTASRMRITGKFRAIQLDEKNKPTILLVEDTKEVVMMLKDYLELAGYEVFTAQDGIDGIVQARHVKPDLILMDVQMPRMDGFETTRKLRSDPNFRYTPIIALTALAMPHDRERCLEAGMDEYISKPVNLKALIKIIQSCLFEQESRTR